jgi:hypothetical protein
MVCDTAGYLDTTTVTAVDAVVAGQIGWLTEIKRKCSPKPKTSLRHRAESLLRAKNLLAILTTIVGNVVRWKAGSGYASTARNGAA